MARGQGSRPRIDFFRRNKMEKKDFLAHIRQQIREQYAMPEMDIKGIEYDDRIAMFKQMTEGVGGKVVEAKEGDDINEIILTQYPDAKLVASNIEGIKADLNPDTVAEAQDLEKVDIGVVWGEIGVAENACVWVPQTMKERAICFIAQRLVILLKRNHVVNNMHEAYRQVTMTNYGYGCFISGPSKTADIEQALVIGAQAACDLTVVLI